jgi:excisionase family DNA binding protein
METIGITIIGTAEQIADGLKRFADRHAAPKPEPEFHEEKMTPAEAAKFMDISYKTLCDHINKGKIRYSGTARKRYVLKSELIEDWKKIK